MRIIVSFVVAFLVAAAAGKCLIPALRRMKAGQSIKEIGPTWHMSKQGTPTMGGLMFIIAIAAAVLTVGWSDIAAGYRGGLFVFLFALVFGIIGYVDDYCKVKKKQNTGLTAPQIRIFDKIIRILRKCDYGADTYRKKPKRDQTSWKL